MTPFQELEKSLNSEVLERNEEIHTAILALVAKRHHFQVGPPGTAKSLLVTRLAQKIGGLPEYGYFHYLLTQFTVPGELYGPPNLKDMRDKGIFRLNTDGKLPKACIAFLDEIFKGNSSILNANLTIMNERKFFNSTDDPAIPLISMFAASNEMPSGDNLNALWDRLHFRHQVIPLQEDTAFMAMLQHPTWSDDKIITLADIEAANIEANKIQLTKNCYDSIRDLKHDLDNEGMKVTERRWMDCIPIIKAEAWLQGQEVADITAMRPLMHVLWEDLDNRKKVERMVLDIANPLDKEAGALYDKLVALETKMKQDLKANATDNKKVTGIGVEVGKKLKTANAQYEDIEKRIVASGASSMVLPKVEAIMARMTVTVSQDIMGFNIATGVKGI